MTGHDDMAIVDDPTPPGRPDLAARKRVESWWRQEWRRRRVRPSERLLQVGSIIAYSSVLELAMAEWTDRLCEAAARVIRAVERARYDGSRYLGVRMELHGQLSGLRTALCLLHGWNPDVDGDKEGPADDLITAWMEAHPEPEDGS